jgi:hypothetical protein
MSGVASVPSGVEPHTNEVQMRTTPMHNLQVVADPTPLEILKHKRRACTGRIAFNSLSLDLKKYVYDKASTIALNSDGVLSYIMAACSLVEKFCLRIEPCDRQTIKKSLSNRVQAAKRLRNEVGEASIVVVHATMADISRSEGVLHTSAEDDAAGRRMATTICLRTSYKRTSMVAAASLHTKKHARPTQLQVPNMYLYIKLVLTWRRSYQRSASLSLRAIAEGKSKRRLRTSSSAYPPRGAEDKFFLLPSRKKMQKL